MKKTRLLSFLLILLLLLSMTLPCWAVEEEEIETTTEASTTTEEVTTMETLDPSITAPVYDSDPIVGEDGLTPAPTGFEIPSPLAEYNFPTDYFINAKSAALIELNTHAIIFSYELDRKVYPASLTKIMTCMLALENGNLDDILTISSVAFTDVDEYSSSAGLVEGERLPLREVLYGVMVSSANEACNAVAEYISGDIPSFVALMNQKAQELGMTNTHFANPHGLHDDDHYTTARDLATLASWAWQNPQFREFATTIEHVLPATELSEERTLHTTNYLTINSPDNKYYYELASGVKTGFTTPAGGCLIATATSGELSFMSVVCGCSTVVHDDGSQTDQRFTQTKELLQFGFDNYSFVQVLSSTAMLDQPELRNAEGRNNVVVHAKQDVTVLLPNSCKPEEVTMKLDYDFQPPLKAPLDEGQRVGTVTAYYTNIPLAKTDLVTLTAVEEKEPIIVLPKSDSVAGSVLGAIFKYWYFTIPAFLILTLIVVLFIVRAVNVRKAKKRAERRRRAAEARRRQRR